jgi:hypothetical protein
MIAPFPLAKIYHDRYLSYTDSRNKEAKTSEFTLGAIEKLLLEIVEAPQPDSNQQTSLHGHAAESQAALMGGILTSKPRNKVQNKRVWPNNSQNLMDLRRSNY